MPNISFDPQEWANRSNTTDKGSAAAPAAAAKTVNTAFTVDEVEDLVQRVVERGVSITPTYGDWFNCGLALADTLGEDGRRAFHALSQMDAVYNEAECDSKYDDCLKAARNGCKVHAATLFFKARQAGVDLGEEWNCRNFRNFHGGSSDGGESGPLLLPTFSDRLSFNDLPYALQVLLTKLGDGPHADMMVVGLLTALSTVMPNVCGTYYRRKVWPSIYAFVVAPPASNKSMLTALRMFLQPVEQELRQAYKAELADYEAAKAQYDANRDGTAMPPQKPPFRSLFLPANSSSTSVYQSLGENDGHGFIFETEGDTMAQSFKSDYGNYSDGLRAAFHHEPIGYCRRKDNERVEIDHPTLSVLLSGTPNQVRELIHDAENGLFSRFLFYMICIRSRFEDVFADDDETYDDILLHLGQLYLPVYHWLKMHPKDGVLFRLTEEQQHEFFGFFQPLLDEQRDLYGDEVASSVMRLGLVVFRMSMALTVLRLATDKPSVPDGGEPQPATTLVCDDRDFGTAMLMANVLIDHTVRVYNTLLAHKPSPLAVPRALHSTQQKELLDKMPAEFTTQQLVAAAAAMHVPKSTANKHLAALVNAQYVARIKNGLYRKL